MEIRRSINTKIWEDTWFESLVPEEKLLWLYLLTNQSTNMVGIYEKSERKISFESGLSLETVRKCFESFERVKKAKYIDGFVILFNWIKNQAYNVNMKISAVNQYVSLPENIRKECDIHLLDIIVKINSTLPNPSERLGILPKKEEEREEKKEEEKDGSICTVEDSFRLFDEANISGRFFSKMNEVHPLNEKQILEQHKKWCKYHQADNFNSRRHMENSFNNWLRNSKPVKDSNADTISLSPRVRINRTPQ